MGDRSLLSAGNQTYICSSAFSPKTEPNRRKTVPEAAFPICGSSSSNLLRQELKSAPLRWRRELWQMRLSADRWHVMNALSIRDRRRAVRRQVFDAVYRFPTTSRRSEFEPRGAYLQACREGRLGATPEPADQKRELLL